MNQKAAILGAGKPPLLSNLNKPWYVNSNEHNSIAAPLPTCVYVSSKRSLLCYCQLQGGNEFLHESLVHVPMLISLTETCISQ